MNLTICLSISLTATGLLYSTQKPARKECLGKDTNVWAYYVWLALLCVINHECLYSLIPTVHLEKVDSWTPNSWAPVWDPIVRGPTVRGPKCLILHH